MGRGEGDLMPWRWESNIMAESVKFNGLNVSLGWEIYEILLTHILQVSSYQKHKKLVSLQCIGEQTHRQMCVIWTPQKLATIPSTRTVVEFVFLSTWRLPNIGYT